MGADFFRRLCFSITKNVTGKSDMPLLLWIEKNSQSNRRKENGGKEDMFIFFSSIFVSETIWTYNRLVAAAPRYAQA